MLNLHVNEGVYYDGNVVNKTWVTLCDGCAHVILVDSLGKHVVWEFMVIVIEVVTFSSLVTRISHCEFVLLTVFFCWVYPISLDRGFMETTF
jgi:hypothetical protein